MPDQLPDKSALRTSFLDRRASMAAGFSDADGRRLGDLFAENFQPACLGLYHPIRGEVPVASFTSGEGVGGAALALPCVTDKNGPLTFRAWQQGADLVKGHYGIMEPAVDQPVVQPSHIILPVVAVDREGYRLGYGGGFYDRTLAAMPDAVTIALAYDDQLVDHLPREAHDIPVDFVLTPSGLVETRPSL